MSFRDVYDRLDQLFSVEDWWPAESAFEIIVGAVLTQNTSWGNVEHALVNLEAVTSFHPDKILSIPLEDLMASIRPAGSYARKAQTIRDLASWYLRQSSSAKLVDTGDLRISLLETHGVGPETADVILLYVFERPLFIFDTYARRMLRALGLKVGRDYESTRILHETTIGEEGFSVAELATFHALVVTAGKSAGRDGWLPILHP
ncbi:endonuclease III domain-containing protein [Trueperella pyogenes]|uniref:endonuclease III domain-containing protein n=1 Tax=Trueperella pyogenes TaxID=1661 RepID=UPI003251DE08